MNDRQQMVCAIALFADGYSHEAIAIALGVTLSASTELTRRGADEQAAGTLGHMATTLNDKDQPMVRPAEED